MGSLANLDWLNRFLDETPGDSVIGGEPRQVPWCLLVKSQSNQANQPNSKTVVVRNG